VLIRLLAQLAFALSFSAGRQEERRVECRNAATEVVTYRFNLALSICPQERAPDEHMLLISVNSQRQPCFVAPGIDVSAE
jgi:hypothetical protein